MNPDRAKPYPRAIRGLAFASLASLSFLALHCSSTPSLSSGSAGPNKAYSADDGDGDRGSEQAPPALPGAPAQPPPAQSPPGEAMPAPACAALDASKPLELFLSSDDSNSMASPVIARRMIRRGAGAPPGYVLRTYEFLNYYNVNYGSVAQGTLGVDAQLRVNEAGEYELQIGVQAPPREVRRPMTLTFVLDTSGSMAGEPIELMREAVRAAASQLVAGDVVSLVTWNTENRVALSGHLVTGANDQALLQAVASVDASGGTDLNGGLIAGYELAELHNGQDRVNRIIVISDGQANVGVTEEQLIGQKADSENKEGIYLVGVGVGEGVNDTLMDTVTDAGNGAYIYLDSKQEAWEMFGKRFAESVEVGARNVQIKARLPWYLSMKRFYGEEYSTEPFKVKPQHLAPGDSMVISQVLSACQGAPAVDADPIEVIANWVEPRTYQKKSSSFVSTVGALKASTRAELARGQAIIGYAEWLKSFSTGAYYNPDGVDVILAEANRVLGLITAADATGADPALAEIRQLITTLQPDAVAPPATPPSVEP